MTTIGPCKHCGRMINDGDQRRGWVHRTNSGHNGKSRCDPDESGLPYGRNAEPIGFRCQSPCIEAPTPGDPTPPPHAPPMAKARLPPNRF